MVINGKQKVFLICLSLLLFFCMTGVASADINDSKKEIEDRYGDYYLVQTDYARFFTKNEWLIAPQGKPKAYGYLTSVSDLTATIWVEYNNQERVEKETVILNKSIKIREFKNYFGKLYDRIIAPNSSVVVVKAFPMDQLVVSLVNGDNFEVLRFYIDQSKDTTKINMHSHIKAFEISGLKSLKNKEILMDYKDAPLKNEIPEDKLSDAGRILKADNYFRSELFFAENLVPRLSTEKIIIHHTAFDGMSVEDIHEMHLQKGWAGIGYHKVILPNGTILDGRPENMVGSHALGANPVSVGIVLVGDFTNKKPTPAQFNSLVYLTSQLLKKYNLEIKNVLPHSAVTKGTECPGRSFPWNEFISRLKSQI